MNNEHTSKTLEPNEFYMNIARQSYGHYGAVTDFKNFRGEPMPRFDDLPANIQKAWHDAVRHAYNAGQVASQV